MARASCLAASVRGAAIEVSCQALPAPDGCCWVFRSCSSPAHMVPQGTRFHDLGHFYALALIAANLNSKVIQARLGHATRAQTMDTYGHLFQDADDLGIQAVDAALASALEVQRRYRALAEVSGE
jgi:hypothetical protein